MSQDEQGVKDIGEVVSPSESPAETNDQDFYADIPEPNEAAQPQEEQVSEEESKQSNKGASERIRELNQAKKEAEAQRDSIARQMEVMAARMQMPQAQLPPPLQGGEITAEELEIRAAQRAEAISQLQLQQFHHLQRVQNEANEVLKDYPQLDPDSDSYEPELSQSVTEAGLAYIRQNPTGSLKKFVSGLMKPYTRSVERKVGDLADTVTRQAAETALRPTQTPKGSKRPEDMSLEELEAKLGKVY